VVLHDVFSVDEVYNKAMKIERLQSKAPPSRSPLSIEELVKGDEVQLSSTVTGHPLAQLTAKASTSTATTPAVAKSKENLYTKPENSKCYRYDELGHKSNECPKRRQVNIADYEEEDEVQIETEL